MIFDDVKTLLDSYYAATQKNPILAALALPLMGGLMFAVRNIPTRLWAFFTRSVTVKMSLNNAGWDGNIDAYNAFDKWFMGSGYQRFSKSFFMFRNFSYGAEKNGVFKPYRLGIGKGTHIFFYRGRLFWFVKDNLDSGGSERQKEEIYIRTIGFSQDAFSSLIEVFNSQNEADETCVHTFVDDQWREVFKIPQRDLNAFCMNKDQRSEIIKKLEFFTKSRDWYKRKGLTYKTSFLFYGPPGTGKTTLAKLLACHFKRDLYLLDLNNVTNKSIQTALSSVKPGSFLLMEDIDQAGTAVRNRAKKQDGDKGIVFLTMSGFLNAFDGVMSLDNVVVMMTTNHPDDLDPAVRRKSRIDNEYLIAPLGRNEIVAYLEQMYDVNLLSALHLIAISNCDEWSIPGCEVENAFKENPDNPEEFVRAMIAYTNKNRQTETT